MLIRPMQKQQKKQREYIKNLKKGDKVVTNGGLYGSIQAVEDDAVVLKLAENVKVRVAKSAVAGAQPGEGKDEL
jgi:preprotein translocase subunit YajC